MKNLSYLFLFILMLASCSSPQDENKSFVEINGNKIPIIDLGVVDEEPTTIGWSSIFEDVEIIPLETDEKCMIMNWNTGLSPNSLYLTTKTGRTSPARLMEFDFDGKYLRDFGRGGKGPGEHTAYSGSVRYYPDFDLVLASFGTYPRQNQLFTPNAEFVGEVKNSFDAGGIVMLEENLFFKFGTLFLKPNYRRDSVLIEWQDRNGVPLKTIERTIYPEENNLGFMPFGGGRSNYRFGGAWRLHSPGNDTIYEVTGKELQPIALLSLGEKAAKLNKFIDPQGVIGSYVVSVFAENDAYWILKKSTYTKCDVEHHGAGQWAGRTEFDHSFIFVDKYSGKKWNIQFEDDLLGIIPWSKLEYYLRWDDSGRFYLILGAIGLIEKIDEAMDSGKIPASGKEKVMKLRESINENSNPVLFMLKERKKYKLD